VVSTRELICDMDRSGSYPDSFPYSVTNPQLPQSLVTLLEVLPHPSFFLDSAGGDFPESRSDIPVGGFTPFRVILSTIFRYGCIDGRVARSSEAFHTSDFMKDAMPAACDPATPDPASDD